MSISIAGDLVTMAERETAERCAKIAEEVAAEIGEGEGEIYIARKIADKIRALIAGGSLEKRGIRHNVLIRVCPCGI